MIVWREFIIFERLRYVNYNNFHDTVIDLYSKFIQEVRANMSQVSGNGVRFSVRFIHIFL